MCFKKAALLMLLVPRKSLSEPSALEGTTGAASEGLRGAARVPRISSAPKRGGAKRAAPAPCQLSAALFRSLAHPPPSPPPLLGVPGARTEPFCLFPCIFKKITALGLMPRIYGCCALPPAESPCFLPDPSRGSSRGNISFLVLRELLTQIVIASHF